LSETQRPPEAPPPGLIAAVALISAAALAAEIVLMRIYSIVEWHHFAWMIISLALLGFGASGTFLAIFRKPLLRHADHALVILPALAAAAMISSLYGALHVPWNSFELLWNPQQMFNLFRIYLLLAVPFFFVGSCIGLTFLRWPSSVGRLYGADLAGAGAGAVVAILLLHTVLPNRLWLAVSALAVASSLLAALALRPRLAWIPLAATLSFAVPAFLPLEIEPGHFKPVTQALRIPGAIVSEVRSTPLGYVQLLESPDVPLRHAPGLSLNWFEELPDQKGIFVDGHGPLIANRTDRPLDHIDATTEHAALAILERSPGNALLLGLSSLPRLVRLVQTDAVRVHVVEENQQLTDLVRGLEGWGGNVLSLPNVVVHTSKPRTYLARTSPPHDLIVIPFERVTAGEASAISPDDLLTVESIASMIGHLREYGVLSLTAPVEVPPRTVPKLLVTVARALELHGLEAPDHVAVVRAWDVATIIVTRAPLTSRQSAVVRQFADDHSFDVAWLPDIDPSEVNRFNILPQPWIFETAREILGSPRSREVLLERYKFDISAPRDERPWFGSQLKWATMIELFRLRDEGGLGVLRSGYPILIVALGQSVVAGVVLILLPLVPLRASRRSGVRSWKIVVCFGSLGIGFLFIEILYIYRLTLFLGQPIEAVSVVLASFLIFAGLGSISTIPFGALVRKLLTRYGRPDTARDEQRLRNAALTAAAAVVAAVVLIQIPLLRLMIDSAIGMPHLHRVGLSVLFIAPLAFAMGLPLPSAIRALELSGTGWIAWAWAINGCASVVSAVLAVLLSLHIGFTNVTLIAAALYVTAGLVRVGSRETGVGKSRGT
jgi:hypothetical protein